MKVAICTPVHGDTKADFTCSLARLCIRSAKTAELGIFTWSSSVLPVSRNKLLENAAAWAADWILWLDADHTFPPDTLERLLAHGRSVVACNYLTRWNGIPVALRHIDGQITRRGSSGATGLEEFDASGLGVCLVSMEACRALAPPAFAQEFFDDGTLRTGEDGWFFKRLKEAGHTLFVDHDLSKEVGHIAQRTLMFSP